MTRILQMAFAAVWAVLTFALYLAVLVVAPILLLTTSCNAQDGDVVWALKSFRKCAHRAWDGSCTYYSYHRFPVPTQHYYRPRNHVYHLPETRVYGYERRRDRDDDREYGGHVECKSQPLRVTGDDKLQENNAEISATERWSLEVENRYGTLYSDARYAKQMRVICIRKVPASVTERGQAALGVRHHICTVTAIACAAPAVRVDEDSRAKRRSEKADEDRASPAPSSRRDR